MVLDRVARTSRIGIRLSVSERINCSSPSSSGLARGSSHTRTASIQAVFRAATDARVEPGDDDEEGFQPRQSLDLMPTRTSRAMTGSGIFRAGLVYCWASPTAWRH